MWNKLSKADKWKLIYAYIISPLWMMASIGSEIASNLYQKGGPVPNVPCGVSFRLAMLGYLPMVIPPVLLRFGYFKRNLNYGLELYISMCISVIASLLFAFLMIGMSGGTLGLLGTLSVYCVLSFGADEYNNMSRKQRYTLTLFTLVAPFFCLYMLSSSDLVGKQIYPPYMPIWEAIFIAVMLNCHLPQKPETPPSSSGQDQHQHGQGIFSSTEQAANPKQDIAKRLVCIGLASIGRKSQYPNPYLTSEREAERHRAEYPFLRQLAERYHDAEPRKVLAKHFMLFKETCLYIAFSLLLKNDAELHALVKKELSTWLTKGLSMIAAVRRKDYMYAFSKAFYDEYQRTHDLERTLSYTFWKVAADRYPDIVNHAELPALMRYQGLMSVYEYIKRTLAREFG